MENNQETPVRKTKSGSATRVKTASKQAVAEDACKERVNGLIEKQQEEIYQRLKALEELNSKREELKKSCKLVERALQKAKENQLGKKKTGLIKEDIRQIKEERKSLKQLIRSEEKRVEELSALIRLLETIL